MILIQVEIVESPELLAQLMEQETNLQRFQKLRMLYLLKTQKVKALRHIAQIMGRHRATLQDWVRHYRQGGLSALLKNKRDRFADIPEWVVECLVARFKDTSFLPSLTKIQAWLQEEHSFTINYHQLHRLLSHTVVPRQQAHRLPADDLTQPLDMECLVWLEEHSNLYERFTAWQSERGFPDQAQALSQLLGEFLGVRPAQGVNPFQQPGMTLIESLAKGALTPKIPYHIPDLLSQQRLSERLGIDSSIPCRERWRRTFPGWTKQRDPDGVGWLWVPELRKYRPLLRQEDIQAVLLSPVRHRS